MTARELLAAFAGGAVVGYVVARAVFMVWRSQRRDPSRPSIARHVW